MSMHHWVLVGCSISVLAFYFYLLFTDKTISAIIFALGYYLCLIMNTAADKIDEQKRTRGQPQVINYKNLIDDLQFKPK